MPPDDQPDGDEEGEEGDEPAQEVEVVDADENGPANHAPSEELDRVATYSVSENGVTYKIIPQIASVETRWTLWAFGSAQGPLQLPNGISDEQAAHLGLSPMTQAELNDTLERVKEEGELPREFRGQPRQRRSIDDLQQSLGMD